MVVFPKGLYATWTVLSEVTKRYMEFPTEAKQLQLFQLGDPPKAKPGDRCNEDWDCGKGYYGGCCLNNICGKQAGGEEIIDGVYNPVYCAIPPSPPSPRILGEYTPR